MLLVVPLPEAGCDVVASQERMPRDAMSRMLILQLERFGRLSSEEKLALSSASLRPRRLAPRLELPREEERADLANVLLSGFACRYAVLPGGRRQILAYLLPGEFCDRCTAELAFPDHSVSTLSPVKIASYAREDLAALGMQFPRIARALALAQIAEQATLRQWLLNVGHRSALERAAHLLCELFTRLRSIGLAHEGVCNIPLKQTDLADALAISAVHLNRTLAEIRRRRLAAFHHHELVIQDWRGLQQRADFQPHYLFAGNPPADPGPLPLPLPESRGIQGPIESSTAAAVAAESPPP
jgi:CRP-like cAMP-binding protein